MLPAASPAPRILVPRITVIVPTYDVAGYVGACIDSICAQTFSDFEVIVVDDGSRDGSAEVARTAAGDDPRFRFVTRENGGLSVARNTGLDLARGEFVCFIDSDDRVAPAYLERLLQVLEQTGADWVACGVMFCHEGGRDVAHPAIHGPVPSGWQETGPVRHDFTDWQEVVRHYPSAWNKIYRRAVIGDLRFDEGLYYEDHPFYYRYSARCDHMVHLPEPLYLHTVGREGQITRDGSRRVFEQFTVLDLMRDVMHGTDQTGQTGRTGAEAAFAQIATRVTYERSVSIGDRAIRAEFLARARTLIGQGGADQLGVPAYWISLLEGRIPVSVVVPSDANPQPLQETLTSLAGQALKEAEILVVLEECTPQRRTAIFAVVAEFEGVSVLVGSGGTRVSGARNRGLAAARGETVVFLDAGDTLLPGALGSWHNGICRAGAECGFGRFVVGDGDVHSGLHDRASLQDDFDVPDGFAPTRCAGVYIHAHPSAKIFDRAFLRRHDLWFPPEPLASWFFLIAVMALADRAIYLEHPPARISERPETRRLWRWPENPRDLVAALERIRDETGQTALDPACFTRLFVRAVWEKVNFAQFASPADGDAFRRAVREYAATLEAPDAPLDGFVGERLRHILGLSIR